MKIKFFIYLSIAIVLSSCATTSINYYCRLTNKYPGEVMFYRDFTIFGLKGMDEISCDEAKLNDRFIFFTYYKDSLDLITIKYKNLKDRYNIFRRRSSPKPLYFTDLLKRIEPTANYDSVLVANSSQFIIHKTVKTQNQYLSLQHYYIWDKISEGHIHFSRYTMTAGNYLNLANYGSNGRLEYDIDFVIQNGSLLTTRKDYTYQTPTVTEKREKFESELEQVFFGSF